MAAKLLLLKGNNDPYESTLTNLARYFLLILNIQTKVVEVREQAKKTVFRNEEEIWMINLINWKKVCKPNEVGGLDLGRAKKRDVTSWETVI